jgi:hypothetical protein
MATSLLRPHAVAGLGGRNTPLVKKQSAAKKNSNLKLRRGGRVAVAAASKEDDEARVSIASKVAANIAAAASTVLVRPTTVHPLSRMKRFFRHATLSVERYFPPASVASIERATRRLHAPPLRSLTPPRAASSPPPFPFLSASPQAAAYPALADAVTTAATTSSNDLALSDATTTTFLDSLMLGSDNLIHGALGVAALSATYSFASSNRGTVGSADVELKEERRTTATLRQQCETAWMGVTRQLNLTHYFFQQKPPNRHSIESRSCCIPSLPPPPQTATPSITTPRSYSILPRC